VVSFAVVGSGYRAAAFWRLAARVEGLTCVGAVTRTPRALPVPALPSLAGVRADFVVTALPRAVNPAVVVEAMERGLPVLSETPPAADLPGLRELWVKAGPAVQVAEQYLLMPSHAARAVVVRAGVIGTPGQVQVSSTQLYHAVSLIRGLLGAGRGPVTVRASRTTAPLLDPLSRAGWTGDATPRPATTTIATLDFGGGRSGLYDFTTNQTRNQLRFRRVLVRGSHGELHGDEVVRLAGPRTIVRTAITRRRTGDLTFGDDVVYRHPWPGARLNDDEIAMAVQLLAMGDWVRGDGPPPYPLAEAAHDQQVALSIDEAADTDRAVTTGTEPWTS
jgi:predicted dehydrogenase